MDTAKARLDLAGVHELCEKFLHRLDDELESERKQRREGRAMSKRQEELESAKAREEQEYGKQGLRECGMWREMTGKTDIPSPPADACSPSYCSPPGSHGREERSVVPVLADWPQGQLWLLSVSSHHLLAQDPSEAS